jgi:hypothetical protein
LLLHVEPANLLHGTKHIGLKPEGDIPGWLPAHRRVHRKDEPSAALRANRRYGVQPSAFHCRRTVSKVINPSGLHLSSV